MVCGHRRQLRILYLAQHPTSRRTPRQQVCAQQGRSLELVRYVHNRIRASERFLLERQVTCEA